jgi:nicotinate-nucleotide adenylyltransferase
MRIGFFGGSFDPPHRGHIALALAAADRFALDRVLLAPAGLQPLKERQTATAFAHRYAMTALAAQADPRLCPSLLDAPLPDRPNYTVETLTRLRDSLQVAGGQDTLFALVGADSALEIGRWWRPDRLLTLCDWIVAARPGHAVGDIAAAVAAALPSGVQAEQAYDPVHGAYLRLRNSYGERSNLWALPEVQETVSATSLRADIRNGAWDEALAPPPVVEYVRKTGLYQATGEAPHWQQRQDTLR